MNWLDLPQVVQLEIFTFLSVKHFGKILSLSKSIHQQVDESDYFWQQLCINYARVLPGNQSLIEKTKALQHDQTEISKHEKYSKHFGLLIKTKEVQIKMLETKKIMEKRGKQLEALRRMRQSLVMKLANDDQTNNEENNETKKENELDLDKELEKLKFD